MSFDIFRTLPLDFLGEGWKDCYIKYSYLTLEEGKKFALLQVNPDDKQNAIEAIDQAVALVEEKFIEGKAISGGQVVDIKKEDLKTFPVSVLNQSIILLSGADDIKKKD